MLRPRSLQSRLLLGILACTLLVQAAASIVAYRVIDRHLWQQFDRGLEDRLRYYQAIAYIKLEDDRIHYKVDWIDWERLRSPNDDDYFQYRYEKDQRPIHKSNTLGKESLPWLSLPEGEPLFQDVKLPKGYDGRLVCRVFLPPNGEKYTPPVLVNLAVARRTQPVADTLRRLRDLLWFAGAGAATLLLGSALFIIRRNVRPVGELAHQIERMPLADASERFSLPGAPSELEPVVGRLNALMDRVTAALANERQFTSAAAHELRTPLAGMRSKIDLALSRERTVEEHEDTLINLREIQESLQQITDNLLLLARLEAGQMPASCEEIELGKVLRRAWRDCFAQAEAKHLQVKWSVEEPGEKPWLPVSLFLVVLRNFFQNATDYTPEGGTIEIAAMVNGEHLLVSVTNTNPGLLPGDEEQIFRPFWRGDEAGDPNPGRAGIGLALCQKIMRSLRGQIEARITAEKITLSARFPFNSANAAV